MWTNGRHGKCRATSVASEVRTLLHQQQLAFGALRIKAVMSYKRLAQDP